jgi:hypothetical protein
MTGRPRFTSVLLHFALWALAATALFCIHVLVVGLPKVRACRLGLGPATEFLALHLAWIAVLSLPIAGLLGSSSACMSQLLRRDSRTPSGAGTRSLSGLWPYLAPAAAIGGLTAAVCLAMNLYVLPAANSRLGDTYSRLSGAKASWRWKNSREKSVGELLAQAKQLSQEIAQADEKGRIGPAETRNEIMVEVHKKFAIPLLGLLLPILGSMLALVLSALKWGQRLLLFLFDVSFLVLVWLLLVVGEAWGDHGVLPPFLSMFLTPALAAAIIAALSKRGCAVLALREAPRP